MDNIQVYTLFFLLVILLSILLIKKKSYIRKNLLNILLLTIVICIGNIYTKVALEKYKTKFVDQEYIKMNVCIISFGKNIGYYSKFFCKNDNNEKFVIYFKNISPEEYIPGDKIFIEGVFNVPSVMRNEGGYNYAMNLYSINTYGMIYVDKYTNISSDKTNIIFKIQNQIRDNFRKYFEKDYAGILSGMLIGETADVSDETIENFQEAGILHLLAVSGANVAMVIIICNFILSKIIGRNMCDYISIILIILFILVSGESSSVMRAGIMAITAIIANQLIRKTNGINNLLISCFIILVINPISIANTGFILSYVATLGIILLSKPIKEYLEKKIYINSIIENISVTIAAQIMLLPIMAYYFNNISLLSLFTNLLIIPISGIISVLSVVIFLFSLINPYPTILLSMITKFFLDIMFFIIQISTKIKFLNFLVITPKIITIFIFYLIIFITLSSNKIGKEKVKVFNISLLILVIIISIIKYLPKNYIELSMIDVGQGDSFYITTQNNKKILIDGGGSENSTYSVGEKILLPYLLDKGDLKIDLIFISHPDNDHIDGILTLIQNIKVEKIIIGPNDNKNKNILILKKLCDEYKIKLLEVQAGDIIKIEKIEFKILYPNKNVEISDNNSSLVFKMFFANRIILFTGDIERKIEEKFKYNLKADILKVAHHGSNSSTTEVFLNLVKPKISLISVGQKNKYGHPSEEVINRLMKYSKIYMTKDSGEVKIRIYEDGEIYIKELIKK